MKLKEKYSLLLSSIKLGKQSVSIEMDDSLFSNYPESEIKKALLKVDLEVERTDRVILIDFFINGQVTLSCDKCLEDMQLEVDSESRLTIEFGAENSDIEEADDRIVISPDINEIDLSKHIYDYLTLSIPYKKVHGTDKDGKSLCNPEMIKKLEGLTRAKKVDTDPRWEKLKDLL